MLSVTPQSLAANFPYGLGAMVSPTLGFGYGGATPGYFTRFNWDPIRHTAYASVANGFNLALGDTAFEMTRQAKRVLGYPDIEDRRFSNTITAASTLISELMISRNIKGLSIALVESNRTVWAQGFGQADVERNIPASSRTVYRIGSVSKVVTAAALLKLWEDGRLDLEAPITDYIPEFSILPRFADTRAPTVRECLNHQSGLPGDLFKGGFTTRPMPGYNDWLLEYLAEDYPNYAPGLRSIYNNTGFQLAAETLIRITSSTLNDYADTNFFTPLGMASSSYVKNKPNISRWLARSYDGDAPVPEEFVNAYGTGGMYSSAPRLRIWRV
jgi:CubicO group peptidase (beta-lactamase class C family)